MFNKFHLFRKTTEIASSRVFHRLLFHFVKNIIVPPFSRKVLFKTIRRAKTEEKSRIRGDPNRLSTSEIEQDNSRQSA